MGNLPGILPVLSAPSYIKIQINTIKKQNNFVDKDS